MTSSHHGSYHEAPTLQWTLLIIAVCGVVAVHMPWHVHDVAAFSNNAFDLAEFVSLHPTAQAENPALLSSILLRLPLVLLPIILTLIANRLRDERSRWIWRGVALLVALRLNPPVDFYRGPGDVSLNERQLGYMMIAAIVLVIVAIASHRWLMRYELQLAAALWLIIVVVSIEGWRRATNIVESLQIEVGIGAGIILIVVLALLSIALIIQSLRQPTHQTAEQLAN